jgi:hypothetical protein
MTAPDPESAGVRIIGPFLPESVVAVDGYRVPHVTARELADGSVDVIVDHRFGLERAVPREEFDRWMPLLAHAMAVAAGYCCHGELAAPRNEFNVRISELVVAPAPPPLTIVRDKSEPSP